MVRTLVLQIQRCGFESHERRILFFPSPVVALNTFLNPRRLMAMIPDLHSGDQGSIPCVDVKAFVAPIGQSIRLLIGGFWVRIPAEAY